MLGEPSQNNYNHRMKSQNGCQNILYEPFVQSTIELWSRLPIYENNELIHFTGEQPLKCLQEKTLDRD